MEFDTYVLGGLFFLNNKPIHCVFLVLGVLFNYALNPILKVLFPRPRPRDDPVVFRKKLASGKKPLLKDLGMPSLHSEIFSFILVFVAFSFKHSKKKWINGAMLFLCLFLLLKEYIIGEHSIEQLFVGLLIGTVTGCFFSFLAYDEAHGWGLQKM
jgi:membrane-associated phospholipid phosphatase